MPVSLVDEVCAVADAVLRARKHLIENDLLDGVPWAAACYSEGIEIVRRRHQMERRRAS